jgi:hypothetical protein
MSGRSDRCLATNANCNEGGTEMTTERLNWPNWLPHLLWIRRECPRCNSDRFKPAELHTMDGLLGMFLLRPVRCMFCWRRYYWFSLQSEDAG